MTTPKEILEFIQKGANEKLETALKEAPTLADGRTEQGISFLQFAAYCRNKGAIELLLKRKSVIDLYEASCIGDVARVASEVEKNLSLVNSFSADGFTPLGLACFFGQHLVASFLVAKGANVNTASNNSFKVAPIHSACAISDVELTTLLIKNGANVNAKQQAGVTPLHEAAHNGKTVLAKLLIDSGSEVNAITEQGQTPHFMAVEKGFHETAALLEQHGGK
jgi:ankyrin repeat protein